MVMRRACRAGATAALLALTVALAVALAVVRAPAQAPATLRVAQLFRDGVVLQRGVPLPVWGWSRPGARVTVELAGRHATATATAQGSWRVELPALAAGGPHVLTIGSGAERVRVERVLVGDVWLAAGQSNMEFKLAAATDGAREMAAAGDSLLRNFRVPLAWADTALAELPEGEWAVADAQHAGGFSAVAYFFAREVRASARVPVGIIDVSWGGSAVETWTSRTASGIDERAWNAIKQRDREYDAGIRENLMRRLGALPAVDGGLVDGRAVWADPALDDTAWDTLRTPGAWERAGLPGLDGVVWYRLTLSLSAPEAAAAATLSLGAIDDNDITWVNGVEVGRTDGYNVPRAYAVPAGVLREGANTIAIRVTDGGGDGGVTGPASQLYLALDGARRPLAGVWRIKVGAVSHGTDGQHTNKIPTVAYNGMIHPLRAFPVRGVIWYQGESNANSVAQAAAYRGQFERLIRSWRGELRGSTREFPFLWVQLPNFGAVDSVPPGEAGWATLRESQHAALRLPRTGEAVAIDQGDPADIHPREKRAVGHRLALAARAVAYGEKVEWQGPDYVRHSVAGGAVTVEFSHAGTGLRVQGGGEAVAGFALAGADHRWAWADARIVGSRVVVSSPAVPNPVAVRYAWSNSPARVNLVSAMGLPVAPFRSDQWK